MFLAVSCSVGLFVCRDEREGLGGLWITQSLKQRPPLTLLLSFPQSPPLLFLFALGLCGWNTKKSLSLCKVGRISSPPFPDARERPRPTAAYFLGSIILHNQTVVRSDTCVFLCIGAATARRLLGGSVQAFSRPFIAHKRSRIMK